MSYKFNPFISTLDYYQRSNFKGVTGTAPTSDIEEGDMYINSGNNKVYVYYNGMWQVLHTLQGITYVTPSVGMPYGLLLALTIGYDA